MINVTQSAGVGERNDLIRIMMPLVIVIIIIIIGKKILDGVIGGIKSPFIAAGNALGVNPSPREQELIKQTDSLVSALYNSGNSPFSPMYYIKQFNKNKGGVKLLTKNASWDFSNSIFNAIGYVSDSPEIIANVFERLSCKTQVSYLSERFEKIHAKNLFDFLTDKLDTPSQKVVLGKIINYVNSLPVGYL